MERSRFVLVVVVFVIGFLEARFGTPMAQASHNFADVPDSAFFHDQVDFLVDSQVTTGCQLAPPLFCPDVPVTRAQMALFLERFAGFVLPSKIDRPFHTFVQCGGGVSRFAVVSGAGAFVRGSAGTSASRLSTGTYVVTFNIDVTDCAWLVTVGQTGSVGATTGVGNVAGRSGNANGLFITTSDGPPSN
jgi:hypothetical protein